MIFNHELYNLTQNVQGAIFQAALAMQAKSDANAGQPASPNPLLAVRRGLAESPGWFMMQAAEFDPEPLTVENLRRRAVWSSERIVAALLELMAGEKWLNRVGEDYHLTDEGRELIDKILQRHRKPITTLDQMLPADDVERLEHLMRRIIDASLESADPPGTWCLVHSRRRAPSDDAAPLLKIFNYCSDFNAVRDDAHMAAFMPLDIPAYAWEAFAQVYDGTANTAQGVYDQLAYRGYSRMEYRQGLEECVRRGWLSERDGVYVVTEAGRGVREEAERLTDQYFYASWARLGEGEAEEVKERLVGLEEMLKGMG